MARRRQRDGVSEPRARLTCCVTPNDSITVRVGRSVDGPRVLLHAESQGGRSSSEVLVVGKASSVRAFAAALLNAADECDGSTPLVYMPAGPTAREPRRWRRRK